MNTLFAIVVLGGAFWLFLTTSRGKQLAERWRSRSGGAALAGPTASDDDHAFLLRICGGDYEELAERLRQELELNPHLSEADAYRKAIRRHMKDARRPE